MPAQIQYPLVQSDREFDRLIEQGRFYGELTERLFVAAGIHQGMRLLDVGCGAGDVSFLAARLVGPRGCVVGVDRSPAAIASARTRAAEAGLENMTFVENEFLSFSSSVQFDAVVGRFILIYQPNPVVVLRHAVSYLRPGGVAVFQETDCSRWPPGRLRDSPLLERVSEWFKQSYIALGAEMQMGMKLPIVFQQAGLPMPETRVESRLVADADSPYYRLIAEFFRMLLPTMERLGIATAAEVDVDTLEARLRAEIRAFGSVVMTPPLVAAWAIKA